MKEIPPPPRGLFERVGLLTFIALGILLIQATILGDEFTASKTIMMIGLVYSPILYFFGNNIDDWIRGEKRP